MTDFADYEDIWKKRLYNIVEQHGYNKGFDEGYNKGKEDATLKWIPVLKHLPKNDDQVIISIRDNSGDNVLYYSDFGWYLEEAKCWIVDNEQRRDIIAWMPKPKPYKEEKNEV